jgi:hypothetical protein
VINRKGILIMDQTSPPIRNSNDDRLSNPGTPRTGTTEEVASYVGHKAEDATAYMGHKAEDAASYVGQKTGEASAAVGSGLRSLGGSVRDRGPEGGMAGAASSAMADSLESSGRYLQEEGLKGMTEDVTNLIRRYPIPALLIGVATGYLVGKALTPRS